MSAVLDSYWRDCDIVQSASSDQVRKFLLEVAVFLNRVVPREEIERLLEEISDHFETMLEADDMSFEQIALEFGSSRDLADNFIQAWYTKRASPSIIEKRMGTGAMFVFGTFGIATLAYWILLQSRVFLPTYTSIRLPWSPGQIRAFFPEPLPFPDFSIQFLLITGIPLLAPPFLGWLAGRKVHISPHTTVYAVLVHIAIVSYIIGILLLPMTDGLVFAIFQTVYWLPVGCLAALAAHRLDRRRRKRRVNRMFLDMPSEGAQG